MSRISSLRSTCLATWANRSIPQSAKSSTACGTRLPKKRNERPDVASIIAIGVAELLRHHPLLDANLDQATDSDQDDPAERADCRAREGGSCDTGKKAGINWVTHDGIGTAADQLMIRFDRD